MSRTLSWETKLGADTQYTTAIAIQRSSPSDFKLTYQGRMRLAREVEQQPKKTAGSSAKEEGQVSFGGLPLMSEAL